MRIVQIVPGTGGAFYCENCIRDLNLAAGLREQGHDVWVLPMYLPLMPGEPPPEQVCPVFYGAVSLYLGYQSAAFRSMPHWLRRAFDCAPMLRLAVKRAGSTRATGLEGLTLSMLEGENGGQRDELERLVDWLSTHIKPDVVHLSNALLIGLAHRLKQELNARVGCFLQDEDTWVNAMDGNYPRQAWELMAAKAKDVDLFFPVSRHYAERMQPLMQIPDSKLQIVHNGIDTSAFTPGEAPPSPPVIGYLSRMCDALGLEILVDAFILLKQDPRFAALQLRALGGATQDDEPLLGRLRAKLLQAGMLSDAQFLKDFDRPVRAGFLKGLTLMSVPARQGEAFGMYQLESLASGIPVVQPALGAFPEVIELTSGGITYEPNDAPTLAAALASLLSDPDRCQTLGNQGRDAVQREFTMNTMAAKTAAAYETIGAST
ncbi:MAG: glycosyltransferase family 4 protein [Verrucomicrobia bacterium]|jgi:glycosyltransferase involved in cell wall biosynthesis|nr:glycosyltransferase family 4 protein [Verrucomicrobiota bacterium]